MGASTTVCSKLDCFENNEKCFTHQKKRVAISNSTDTNSKPSETRHFLNPTHFNLDKHKLENKLIKFT